MIKLFDDYSIREMEKDEFFVLQEPLRKEIFRNRTLIPVRELLTEEEFAKVNEYQNKVSDRFELYLGLYKGEEFVGWSWGFQRSGQDFYMCNSALLPEYRGKGLYKSLIGEVVKCAEKEGFQTVSSLHTATDNAVLIPKLQAGFNISSMEMTDTHGVLVKLMYYVNPLRRKVLSYRSGQIRMDDELKKYFHD